MLQAIAAIESYSLPSYDAFLSDEKTQDAVMFNLIILGEAANRVPEYYQNEHSEIPWSSMIGTRNVIIHGYDQVKLPIVWDIIHRDLQTLKEKLMELI
jgi:uncharacterized protein with HEPN domain